MKGYEVEEKIKIEDHITFIRINPTDVSLTLTNIYDSLSDLAWITTFDDDYMQDGFRIRAEDTIKYISKNIVNGETDDVTSNSGELVVSELSRMSVITEMDYQDIPLAELIKIKDIGNHGYDFYSVNKIDIILFAEAKYVASQNAYGRSMKQLVRFENEKQDVSDIVDIDRFCSQTSKNNFANGQKGFIAAFASKGTNTQTLINGIKRNLDFQALSKFDELICIAVDI